MRFDMINIRTISNATVPNDPAIELRVYSNFSRVVLPLACITTTGLPPAETCKEEPCYIDRPWFLTEPDPRTLARTVCPTVLVKDEDTQAPLPRVRTTHLGYFSPEVQKRLLLFIKSYDPMLYVELEKAEKYETKRCEELTTKLVAVFFRLKEAAKGVDVDEQKSYGNATAALPDDPDKLRAIAVDAINQQRLCSQRHTSIPLNAHGIDLEITSTFSANSSQLRMAIEGRQWWSFKEFRPLASALVDRKVLEG